MPGGCNYSEGVDLGRIRQRFIEKLSKRYPHLDKKELERIARSKGK